MSGSAGAQRTAGMRRDGTRDDNSPSGAAETNGQAGARQKMSGQECVPYAVSVHRVSAPCREKCHVAVGGGVGSLLSSRCGRIDMAQEQMNCAEMLEKCGPVLLEAGKRDGMDTTGARMLWEYESGRFVDMKADVKRLMELYK